MTTYTIANAEKYISENKDKINDRYRYHYHVQGEYGWINDPNGFSYFNGKYHLFYQHYPYASHWGPMHWGHVESEDLVNWKYKKVALAPDMDYDKEGCFSGSAIADKDKLYLLYTGHTNPDEKQPEKIRQVQCLAVSTDGNDFVKHEANPVITTEMLPEGASIQDFRDPKVWKENDTFYCIIGSRNKDDSGQILLYKSQDMLKWDYVSTMLKSENKYGKMWECPDFFHLDGKDVLIVSPQFMETEGLKFANNHACIYFIGKLDYETGIFEIEKMHEIDSGLDFYAPQTTTDKDGNRIMTAWMQMWDREMPTQDDCWAGGMILTRTLNVRNNQLVQQPVKTIENYRTNAFKLKNQKVNRSISIDEVKGNCIELVVELKNINSKEFGLKLLKDEKNETLLKYDATSSCFMFNRDKGGIGPKGERKVKINLNDNTLKLRIFIDYSSVEIFINDGLETMANTVYPNEGAIDIEFFASDEMEIKSLEKYDIKIEEE